MIVTECLDLMVSSYNQHFVHASQKAMKWLTILELSITCTRLFENKQERKWLMFLQFAAESYEKDLEQALLLSKIEFEEKKEVGLLQV